MKDRRTYKALLIDYPDLFTTKDLRKALGDIAEKTALKLLQEGQIKSYRVGRSYRIPKKWVIDFLMSDAHNSFQIRLAAAGNGETPEAVENAKRQILLLCEQPQSRKDLMTFLNVESKKTFFRLYLHPLLESGELQMTVPNQRSISTQRYIRAKMNMDR